MATSPLGVRSRTPIAASWIRAQPTSVGVPGELYLGGDGLAHGYVNLPELTTECFVPDPFSSEAGRRLYRTGDLARYLPDGNMEFLGRRDRQVKIRGYRVEPGEIESALGGYLPVRTCAVVTKAVDRGEKELVAFLVPSDNGALSVRALRDWLAQTLPDHMIPSRFVALETLPLTPNGKVDRDALERLTAEPLPVGTRYQAPRTELERQLVEIWQAVLRRQPVGIHDHFLEMGGHSLLAISVLAAVRDRLALNVPQRWVFDYPTIAALASQMERLPRDPGSQQPMARADRNQPLPMSFGQERMWLLQQTQCDPATYNEPVAYRLDGTVDRDRLRACLRRLMERHEILRTALVRRGEALLQRVVSIEDASLASRRSGLG